MRLTFSYIGNILTLGLKIIHFKIAYPEGFYNQETRAGALRNKDRRPDQGTDS